MRTSRLGDPAVTSPKTSTWHHTSFALEASQIYWLLTPQGTMCESESDIGHVLG